MSEKEEREGVRREGKGPSGAKRDTDLERRDRVVPPSTSGGRHIDKVTSSFFVSNFPEGGFGSVGG